VIGEALLIKPQTKIEVLGKTSTGLVIANFGGEGVYICETEMTVKEIEAYNKSPHACRILAALEMDPHDSNVAKKIAISNPRSKDDCSDTLVPFEEMLRERKVYKIRQTFEAILKALLDVRVRLPPIFYIDPKLILVDHVTFDVKIIVSAEMVERQSKRP
jgi:hypothetical protein